LSKTLYNEIAGRRNGHAVFQLGEQAKSSIMIWKCALIGLACSGRKLARPMVPHVRNSSDKCSLRVRFDGCPAGVGWVVQPIESNEEINMAVSVEEVIAWGSDRLWSGLNNDPKYQNTAELIAVVLGLAWVSSNFKDGVRVEVVGDSVTVLQWLTGEKFSGEFGRSAAVVMMKLITNGHLCVGRGIHVSADKNQFCDDLSRDKIPVGLKDNSRVRDQKLLQLMNPLEEFKFVELLNRIDKALL